MRSDHTRHAFVTYSLLLGGLQGLSFGLITRLEPASLDAGTIVVLGVFGAALQPLLGFFGMEIIFLVCLINCLSGLRAPLAPAIEASQGLLVLFMGALTAAAWLNGKRRLVRLEAPAPWPAVYRWAAPLPIASTAAYWCLALLPAPGEEPRDRPVLGRAAVAAVMALAAAAFLWFAGASIDSGRQARIDKLKTQLESPR